MRDFYLRFADQAEALAVLEADGVTVTADETGATTITYLDTGLPDGMLIVKAVGADMDGIVYAAAGETATDAEGNEYQLMAAVEGFHVNIRASDAHELPTALASCQVTPEPDTPAERFA